MWIIAFVLFISRIILFFIINEWFHNSWGGEANDNKSEVSEVSYSPKKRRKKYHESFLLIFAHVGYVFEYIMSNTPLALVLSLIYRLTRKVSEDAEWELDPEVHTTVVVLRLYFDFYLRLYSYTHLGHRLFTVHICIT